MGGSRPASVKRAIARIRQLSCLGLDGQLVMPHILRELHALVPSHANDFMWADTVGEISNAYSEHPDIAGLVPLFFAEFHGSREEEVCVSFREAMRRANGPAVQDFCERYVRVERRVFLGSAFHNEFLRPLGYYQRLTVTIREAGRSLGALLVNREEHDRPFTKAEAKSLEWIAPHIAHALAARGNFDFQLADADDHGLIIADTEGRIHHLSREANKLLLMVCHPRWSAAAMSNHPRSPALPPPVARICSELVRAVEGRTTTEMEGPPVWHHAMRGVVLPFAPTGWSPMQYVRPHLSSA